ncbi:MAG TPA: hydrogenase 3 maturation endopeptidase HyCI [Candidatus Cryosericum sp.]|nr:hydrogenase 3 maturation endopeptidase HyCI [Candidatus Cryosericum sp.]
MSELEAYLNQAFAAAERISVVGVGTELCRDDAAGLYLVERLAERTGSALGKANGRLLLISGGPAPENFTGLIKAFLPDLLVVVDAAYLELPAGSIQILPEERAAGLSFSTHMLPLPMMLAYLKLECACQTLLIGIQPATTEQGLGMSESVKKGAELLSELMACALESRQ